LLRKLSGKVHRYIFGKIKTRSYVDKDGINKYITEILADTLLLLEKKQGPVNTAAQTDKGRDEVHGKASSGASVNEPSASYQAANEDSNKNWPDKDNAGSDYPGIDGKKTDRAQVRMRMICHFS
jgi:single-stranded DNA-binding protein